MTAPAVAGAAAAYLALDAVYRAALAQTSLAVAQAMLSLWATVDPKNLARSSPRWIDGSVQLIVAGQSRAASLTNLYTERIRQLSIPNAELFTPPAPRPPNLEQIRKSVVYTGIGETGRELGRLESVLQDELDSDFEDRDAREERESAERTAEGRRKQIMDEGIRRAVGAAIRHITTAGHDQAKDNVMADKRALGWYRTTRANACFFCAMLASRGLVYKEDSFRESNAQFSGPGDQKVHDKCGCGLRPVYLPDDPLPDQTAEFEKLWTDEAARYSGQEAILRFRRAYEGRKEDGRKRAAA